MQHEQADQGFSLTSVQLDDYVAAVLAFRIPFRKYRKLRRTQRPFIVCSIEGLVQLYRIRRLSRFFPGEAIFEIDHDVSLSSWLPNGRVQRALHAGWVAGDRTEIGARRLVRLFRALLPVAQCAERDLIP